MLQLLVNVQRRFTISATMCVVAKYECVASLLQCNVNVSPVHLRRPHGRRAHRLWEMPKARNIAIL